MARFGLTPGPSLSRRVPLAATPPFSICSIPTIAGRFFPGDEAHGSRQRPGYLVTPQLSLSCPMHAGKKPWSVQKLSPPEVKQAAHGETLTAILKKKLMKNNLSGEAAAPANASQRSSKAERVALKYNVNRELPTQTVLDLLKAQLPRHYELAEIVGKWIWLEFPAASHRAATHVLMRLGFHWNQRRGVWQHPCGACAPFAAHPQDPRTKYGSYFAADLKPI